ncbi:hypothetical protein MYSEV_022 [Mythimna separata entomopoxvirus 'L']|uniref:Uncharacterized protein n=1 Tax=Mythimna separata entomopoxvirus 'L' TaxID=1293572 RepID=A0A916KQ74_9POXV|nr:hypothetical protein MYSEV_022 [Mythimna separata entomopoxvirus 'L']CCU56220.1 hypothetical protein MYSEV_022 [Mythimna separata entomopoxvirus 'L']
MNNIKYNINTLKYIKLIKLHDMLIDELYDINIEEYNIIKNLLKKNELIQNYNKSKIMYTSYTSTHYDYKFKNEYNIKKNTNNYIITENKESQTEYEDIIHPFISLQYVTFKKYIQNENWTEINIKRLIRISAKMLSRAYHGMPYGWLVPQYSMDAMKKIFKCKSAFELVLLAFNLFNEELKIEHNKYFLQALKEKISLYDYYTNQQYLKNINK